VIKQLKSHNGEQSILSTYPSVQESCYGKQLICYEKKSSIDIKLHKHNHHKKNRF
jgi:hypothetical protein